jgi:hypothetical protein
MVRVEATETIKRSIEDVWAYLLEDPANELEWVSGAMEREKLTDGPTKKGTRVRGVDRFLGRRMQTEWEVIEYDPPRRRSDRILKGPFEGEFHSTLEPAEGGTRVRVAGESPGFKGFFGKLADPLVAGIFRRELAPALGSIRSPGRPVRRSRQPLRMARQTPRGGPEYDKSGGPIVNEALEARNATRGDSSGSETMQTGAMIRQRKRLVAGIVTAAVVVIGFGIYWFGPQYLFTDRRVDEALPTAVAPDGEAGGLTVLAEGSFRSLAHESTGTAKIVELADGTRVLRLEDLDVFNGPDLRV